MEKLHPAVTVTNIKNFIPITLEMENAQYASWAELFKIHCRAFQAIDHILPNETIAPEKLPSGTDSGKDTTKTSTLDPSWQRVDAIVLQWIYGTISNDLLHTILKPDSTAAQAWTALPNIFQDNANSRALFLQTNLTNTKLASFPNVSAYCQEIKVLADQLANVNAPVPAQTLVLHLISGLTDQFEGVATILQQQDPLPNFYTAQSKLIMEETRKANQTSSNGSFLAAVGPTPNTPGKPPTATTLHTATGYCPSQQPPPFRHSWNPNSYQNGQQWSSPPCPYPTTPFSRPPRPPGPPGPGILGAPPAQVCAASENYYTPTNIKHALHTMTLNPYQNWYLDTGAKNHMTHSTGTLSSYINNSSQNHIVIGNGFKIPINGTGYTTLSPPFPPFKINNVLFAPHLIKNLLSVRRLTTYNHIAIEFDPFGFLVKDFQTKIPILRCDSTGDLYPLTLQSAHTNNPSTFAALSQDLWHQRQGHPGVSLLRVLNKNKSISVSKISDSNVCQSWYPANHRGYKCYDLSSCKILLSRHAIFEENIFPFQTLHSTPPKYDFLHTQISSDTHPSPWESVAHTTTTPAPISTNSDPTPMTQPPTTNSDPLTPPPIAATPLSPNTQSHPPPLQTYSRFPKPTDLDPPSADSAPSQSTNAPPPPTRTMTTRSMAGITKTKLPFNLNTTTTTTFEPLPHNPHDALANTFWNRAMTDEFNALIDNKTSQEVAVDCHETFSSVVKPATIRTILSIALFNRWEINQLDVKNTFLHGFLSETVYMPQPLGFRDSRFPHHVCQLKKSLYWLKQAPRAWQETAYVLLYADDIILTTSSPTLKAYLMSRLYSEFAMKDLGPLSYFLGISITRDSHGLFLSQHKYASDILARAKMTECNPIQTPVDTAGKLSSTAGELITDATTYRSLAGALQYLTFTRPNI
ncbi:hypothetical protein L2E82_51659 [Cichorium intybus]|nr:hypothetical protein L2E82_51659 [Cichorium intybus]